MNLRQTKKILKHFQEYPAQWKEKPQQFHPQDTCCMRYTSTAQRIDNIIYLKDPEDIQICGWNHGKWNYWKLHAKLAKKQRRFYQRNRVSLMEARNMFDRITKICQGIDPVTRVRKIREDIKRLKQEINDTRKANNRET